MTTVIITWILSATKKQSFQTVGQKHQQAKRSPIHLLFDINNVNLLLLSSLISYRVKMAIPRAFITTQVIEGALIEQKG